MTTARGGRGGNGNSECFVPSTAYRDLKAEPMKAGPERHYPRSAAAPYGGLHAGLGTKY